MHPFLATLRDATQRGILTGHQCLCGQFPPDFVTTDHAEQFRTECCGTLYQRMSGFGELQTLSVIERGPGLPSEAEARQAFEQKGAEA